MNSAIQTFLVVGNKSIIQCFLQGPAGVPGLPGVGGRAGAPVRAHPLCHLILYRMLSMSHKGKCSFMVTGLTCPFFLSLRSFLEAHFIMLLSLQGLMGRPGPMGESGKKGEKVRIYTLFYI